MTSAVAMLGVILLFLLIMFVFYIGRQHKPVDSEIVAARKARLSEHRAKAMEQTTTYAWIDEQAGIVQIPVERAMELVVEESQRNPQSKRTQ